MSTGFDEPNADGVGPEDMYFFHDDTMFEFDELVRIEDGEGVVGVALIYRILDEPDVA